MWKKKRNHNFEVISTEEKHQISINRIQFNIKIDRIDSIYPNKKIIIDYKTGETESINSLYNR